MDRCTLLILNLPFYSKVANCLKERVSMVSFQLTLLLNSLMYCFSCGFCSVVCFKCGVNNGPRAALALVACGVTLLIVSPQSSAFYLVEESRWEPAPWQDQNQPLQRGPGDPIFPPGGCRPVWMRRRERQRTKRGQRTAHFWQYEKITDEIFWFSLSMNLEWQKRYLRKYICHQH